MTLERLDCIPMLERGNEGNPYLVSLILYFKEKLCL